MLRKIYCLSERIVAINLSWNCKSKSIKEYFLVTKWLYDCPPQLRITFPKGVINLFEVVELCPKGGSNRKVIAFSVHYLVIRLYEGKHASHEFSVEISSEVGKEPNAPRTASRQHCRVNAPHDTPEEYCCRNLFIPFLDYITQEISSR